MVIFLDDLQWADLATFHLIELMLTDPDCEYLYMIGAYRENEVDDSHPLIKTLKDIQAKRLVQVLSLDPLALENTIALISDSFENSSEKVKALAEAIQGKTRGNPFFIKMFLKNLYQEKLLQFSTC